MRTKTRNEYNYVCPLRLPPCSSLLLLARFLTHPLCSSSLPSFSTFQTLPFSSFLSCPSSHSILCHTFHSHSLLLSSSLLFPHLSLHLLIITCPGSTHPLSSSSSFFSFLSFASPPFPDLSLPEFSPALLPLRLYFPHHLRSLSSSLVFLYFTLLFPVTYSLPKQHLRSLRRRLTPHPGIPCSMGGYPSINAGRQSHPHPMRRRRSLIQQRARVSSHSLNGRGDYCPPNVPKDSTQLRGGRLGCLTGARKKDDLSSWKTNNKTKYKSRNSLVQTLGIDFDLDIIAEPTSIPRKNTKSETSGGSSSPSLRVCSSRRRGCSRL